MASNFHKPERERESCQTDSNSKPVLDSMPQFSRRRFLVTVGAASASMVLALQPKQLHSQVFSPEETSKSQEEVRTVTRDVIEFGFVLKELPGPSVTHQPCNGGFLVQEAEPVGWLAAANWLGWEYLKATQREREEGVPNNKVYTTQKTFQSKGFTFWTADANFQLPTTEAAIMAMAAPGGSIGTNKGPTGAASVDLKLKEGQANPWSSNWYSGVERDANNNPVEPEIKYVGQSHDGGLTGGGEVGCTANWNGNGWGWQGSHTSNGSLVKGTFNMPLPIGALGFEYSSTNNASVDKTTTLSVQWNFVVVSRKRVDTKDEKRPNSNPATPWADVLNSLRLGEWGPWIET